ncbi:MAG TPA: hypothetical protein VLQ68_05230, partial [Rhizobiaceae bacterium]|nr:hypothetical protein [Rhizobiaceae bacterium]
MTEHVPFERHAETRETLVVAAIAAAVGLATGLFFILAPQIDIAVSRSFQLPGGEFALSKY